MAHHGPIGTFVGPKSAPVIKLRLQPDGTYVADDIGPAEFQTMAEGNKLYSEPVKFPPQRGHWVMDDLSGQLTLSPDTAAPFRWDTKHLRYDKSAPDQMAWGDHAFLARAVE